MAESKEKFRGIHVVKGEEVDTDMAETAPGINRAAAISYERFGAEKLWVGKAVIKPLAKTGAHHHGSLESVIYVVSGRALLRWGDNLEFATEAGPGDFIYVPPSVPHEEINVSSDEPLVSILVRSDKDPVMVSLDSPAAESQKRVA